MSLLAESLPGIIDIGAIIRSAIKQELSRFQRSDRLHTAKEVARLLRVSAEHIYKLAEAGELKRTYIGLDPASRREWRISSSAIREFLRRRQEAG